MRNVQGHHVVGTRIHTNCGSTFPDLSQFSHWCQLALGYADHVLIATDDQLFQVISQMRTPFKQVSPLRVRPWHGFSIPLNTIVAEATRLNGYTLLMQSFEVFVSPQSVEVMQAHLASETLVVGARLTPDHGGTTGVKPIDGLTTPWNTLALWDLDKLQRTGFRDVPSELLNGIPGGMEEVSTISLLQHLFPDCTQAKIVTLPDVQWNLSWNDAERSLYHHQKILTKRERAEMQLKHLPVPRGTVTVL